MKENYIVAREANIKAWQTLELTVKEFFDKILGENGTSELEVRKSNPNFALDIPDYENSVIAVECKSKKQGFPKSILDAFEELAKYKEAKGKIPMVVLHKNPRGDNYLVIKMDDLEKLVRIAAELMKCVLHDSSR